MSLAVTSNSGVIAGVKKRILKARSSTTMGTSELLRMLLRSSDALGAPGRGPVMILLSGDLAPQWDIASEYILARIVLPRRALTRTMGNGP